MKAIADGTTTLKDMKLTSPIVHEHTMLGNDKKRVPDLVFCMQRQCSCFANYNVALHAVLIAASILDVLPAGFYHLHPAMLRSHW